MSAITWIPSEAVTGAFKVPFKVGISHYDAPPPEQLDPDDPEATIEELRAADRFRFANLLSGWIEVEDGRIVGFGQGGRTTIGSTTMRLGASVTVAAVTYDTLAPEPEVGPDFVRFRQTGGGRTGVPAPRRVSHPPFVQIVAPTAWTTLELTIHADGRVERNLVGASPFPRHWIYDDAGTLVQKSGMVDFKDWFHHAFGKHSPWGDEDSEVLATQVETALERELSATIMRSGRKPKIRKLGVGDRLTEQGQPGDEMFLVLDGILLVEVDGERVAELGPGSVVGERALLEGGTRTSTLVAATKAKVAVAHQEDLAEDLLVDLRESHRREESLPSSTGA